MKFLSAILVTLILFLTVQPVLTNSNFTETNKKQVVDKCCSDKQNTSKHKNQQESNNNCCNKGHCDNPFLSCANCYFINGDNSNFLIAQVFDQNKKFRLTNDKALSSYISDFWHPPKII